MGWFAQQQSGPRTGRNSVSASLEHRVPISTAAGTIRLLHQDEVQIRGCVSSPRSWVLLLLKEQHCL